MPELNSKEPAQGQVRPFPWFCPRCRRKEVRRATIAYQCERLFQGRPITVTIAALAVPKCANCGELVFDYLAEEQINHAYQVQTAALGNGPNGENNSAPQPSQRQPGEKQGRA